MSQAEQNHLRRVTNFAIQKKKRNLLLRVGWIKTQWKEFRNDQIVKGKYLVLHFHHNGQISLGAVTKNVREKKEGGKIKRKY